MSQQYKAAADILLRWDLLTVSVFVQTLQPCVLYSAAARYSIQRRKAAQAMDLIHPNQPGAGEKSAPFCAANTDHCSTAKGVSAASGDDSVVVLPSKYIGGVPHIVVSAEPKT